MGGTPSWALITGGNRGLGLEVARKLVAAGRPVIITARDAAAGEAAAAQLRAEAAGGAGVEVMALDAASRDSIQALAAEVAARFAGQISLLVNNAGIYLGPWDAPSHASVISTNVDGAVGVALALLPSLADGGRVVNVASGLGMLGMLTPDYADPIKAAPTLDAARAAAARFDAASPLPAANSMCTQIMASDPAFAAKRVSSVAVCPGWCATDMGNASAAVLQTAPPRSAAQGADSILMAADAEVAPSGSFSQDGKLLDWTGKPF
ncbi:MAG: hypothetical protein J3K34DRAFT_524310 [Monoraphidium minutum]|nr:MAG: hypothetical protein J3K34DRAFT_524310 [Monoraphidium minutum]